MAQLQQPFNANAVDPAQGGGNQFPVGKHPVVIIASEIKATKAGDGGMLQLDCQIIDGPSKGAEGTVRLNLYNANEQARNIAEKQLSALCHATGVFMLNDSAQLHGIPFAVDVGLQRDAEAAAKGYTEVKRFLNADGTEIKAGQGGQAQAPAQAPAPAPTPAPAPAAGGWGGGQAQAPAQAPAPAAAWSQAPAAAPAATGKPAWGK